MEYISIETKTVLRKPKKKSTINCSYNISSYHGCEFNCIYCSRYQNGDSPGNESDKIRVEINSSQILKKELKHAKKNIVCISGYQPAEKIYKVIRKNLTVLNSRRFPVHILTRSPMVLDDLELISKIAIDSWCSVSFCLTSLDKKFIRNFEGDAPDPQDCMDAMGKLSDANVQTGIILSPVFPYITDSDEVLKKIIDEAVKNNAAYFIPKILTLEDAYRAKVIQKVKELYPKLVIKYQKLYKLGPEADVRYIRGVLRKINNLTREFNLPNTLPMYSEDVEKKQVNLENFFK